MLDLQAAVAIQKHWRGCRVRTIVMQQQSAAIVIQQHWRGHAHQCTYRRLQCSTICIQTRVRQWQASMRFALMRGAAIYIQVNHLPLTLGETPCDLGLLEQTVSCSANNLVFDRPFDFVPH
jgi:hypothetical protein